MIGALGATSGVVVSAGVRVGDLDGGRGGLSPLESDMQLALKLMNSSK